MTLPCLPVACACASRGRRAVTTDWTIFSNGWRRRRFRAFVSAWARHVAGEMRGHVLSRFHPDERDIMQEAYERTADAIEYAIAQGFELAMNRYNVSEKPAKEAGAPPSA